nr:AAC(3) family N-acetyltransferase [Streptomyces sp. OUCMDZ-3434]
MLDARGEDGTLVLPTHSGDNCDAAGWSTPPAPESSWPAIRATMPPYDPRPAHHPEPPRRRRPGDRPHLARRPAQRPSADLLRRPTPRGLAGRR